MCIRDSSNPSYCTKDYAFTAYVPDSMRPSAALTVTLVNDNALLEQWGLWVRGMSCLQYAVEASACLLYTSGVDLT